MLKIKSKLSLLALSAIFIFASCGKENCEKEESLAEKIEGSYCYNASRINYDGLAADGQWNAVERVDEKGFLEIEAINDNQVRITDHDAHGVNYSYSRL